MKTNTTASLNKNEAKKGLEITFTEKPSETIRQQLKDSGFRWSQKLGFWWAKETPDRLKIALEIVGASKPKQAKKSTTKKASTKETTTKKAAKKVESLKLELSELSDKTSYEITMADRSKATAKGYVFTAKLGTDLVHLGVHKNTKGEKTDWVVSELSTGGAVAHAEKRYLALEKVNKTLVSKLVKKLAEISK